MKNILLIGVGGAGSKTVDVFYKKIKEFGTQNDNNITAIVFDTDKADIQQITSATPIPMADSASVGTICDRLGKKFLREWFPCDDKAVRSQEMIRGASQWRKKSYLAFMNLMNKNELRSRFINALEKMVADPNAICEVYVISSVAGGTGSGSFIPIALFAKKFLRKNLGKDPIVNAMILLPDIFRDKQTDENRIKVVANAYAILRELNAINLVARNYNEGRFDRKRSKINIRIGSPDEPNVGVLFDSNDPEYWTPSAAPFSQIFMLDKMTGVSAFAHNIVLANALYTLICTKTGGEFDSEASNHEVVRSQNNGASAIFAGIATSQINFPQDALLSYLAHRKALDSCNDEWLSIYQAAERKIKEREKQAKEMGVRYVMKNGEYARIVQEVIGEFEEAGKMNITDILAVGTQEAADSDDEEEGAEETKAERYYNRIQKYISARMPDDPFKDMKDDKAKPTQKDVIDLAKKKYAALEEYFEDCFNLRRRLRSTVADAIISFAPGAELSKNMDLSLEENLLKYGSTATGRKYIHPLAALAQLSELKVRLLEDGDLTSTKPWEEVRNGYDEDAFAAILGDLKAGTDTKSKYAMYGQNRFLEFGSGKPKKYGPKGSNFANDYRHVKEDADKLFTIIQGEATKQIKYAILKRVSDSIDLLIEKYRTFFKRFEKERETLEELTANALYMDSGLVNGTVNVLSSQESKKKIAKEVFGNAGAETEDEIAEMYDIVGKSVYKTVYTAAVAAKNATEEDTSSGKKYNDKDSAAYRSLFGEMIASYKKFISRDDAFKIVGESNVVEAIERECDDPNDKNAVAKKLREYFDMITILATPSIKWREDGDLKDLIRPSKIMVYMMSTGTAQYIKRRADFYGIGIPAGMTSEKEMIEACAKGFVEEYSNDQKARTVVVDGMPNGVIYCTGEIMDITPMRVDKFDELSVDENSYYRAYRTAVESAEKYDTDMWNPHLGFGWYKRGYLPYLNDAMEEIADKKMAKALLYALATGGLMLDQLANSVYVFRKKDHSPVNSEDGGPINMKNIAQLVSWIRNEDTFVEENSKAFDEMITHFKNSLPNIASDQEVATLKGKITQSDFMSWMTTSLFKDASSNIYKGSGDTAKKGPNILEFAFLIKVSEESTRDNDDAERVATVAYDVFKEICAFRANPETSAERYIDVYKHELDQILESIANSKLVRGTGGGNPEVYFNQFVSWLNDAGLFLDINQEDPFEADGVSIRYRNYVVKEDTKVFKALKSATKEAKAAAAEAKAAAKAAAEEDAE